MKRRFICFLTVVIMLLPCMPVISYAEIIESGQCGDSLTYTLDTDGTLTVSGAGDMAFEAPPWEDNINEIKKVILEDGVSGIANGAFDTCSNLTSVSIPDSVTSIGIEAFFDCESLTYINIPHGITDISDRLFCGCTSLESIYLPESVTRIGQQAFCYCRNLKSVNIPGGVTAIGDLAFCGCKSLASIEIPNGVTSISAQLFDSCNSLTSIIIPDMVTTIGEWAFFDCSGLKSITIPNQITSIAKAAFSGCDNLTQIYFNGTAEEWENINIELSNDVLSNVKISYSDIYTNSVTKKDEHEYSLGITINSESLVYESASLIAAVYDENGCLCGVQRKDITHDDKSIGIDVAFTGSAYSYKLMLWDNNTEMRPVCASYMNIF